MDTMDVNLPDVPVHSKKKREKIELRKLAPSALAGVRLSLDPEVKIMAPRLHYFLVVLPICRRLKNYQF